MKLKLNVSKKGAIISLSVVILGVLVDFLTKIAVMKNMAVGQSIPLIEDVLHLTYITNKGAAFGSFSDKRWVFMSVSALLIVVLVAIILLWKNGNALFYTATSLILAGGIGNMIDRIAYGYVVDFIDFCAFPKLWQWIFNGADSFVCVGAGMLMLWYILEEIKNYKKSKEEAIENLKNEAKAVIKEAIIEAEEEKSKKSE
jgi:signal peptidase II